MTSGSYSMWYYINVLGITHYLENTNGTPAEQVYYHNAFQQIARIPAWASRSPSLRTASTTPGAA